MDDKINRNGIVIGGMDTGFNNGADNRLPQE